MAQASNAPLAARLWTALVGTGASLGVIGVLGYVLLRRQDRAFAASHTPNVLGPVEPGAPGPRPDPNVPLPSPSPPLSSPARLSTSTVPLQPGRRYLAAIDISFPLSVLATVAKVRAQAESMGFSDVLVTADVPPPRSPPIVRGADYYVEGTYVRGPATIARSQASGRVVVKDAWVLR